MQGLEIPGQLLEKFKDKLDEDPEPDLFLKLMVEVLFQVDIATIPLLGKAKPTPIKPTPRKFIQEYNTSLENPILADILLYGDRELTERKQKMLYAQLVLPFDVYSCIGEDWLTAPGMTLDKICTIGIGEPSTEKLGHGGLTANQARAMTGEWLAHEGITVGKITILGFSSSPEDIFRIGPGNIAKMTYLELYEALDN